MKLFLSSYRIPDVQEFAGLAGEAPAQTKLALIPNAKDYYAEGARNFKIDESKEYFASVGYSPDVVDLREYDDPETLKNVLGNYAALWAMGGNTFCLRYEMRRSGFEDIIRDLLADGLVYGGDSAGAIVAGTSLKGIELADEPAFAKEIIWDGMNLVPKFILPHADSPNFALANRPLLLNARDNDDFVVLNDNQALVVDGERTRKITASPS